MLTQKVLRQNGSKLIRNFQISLSYNYLFAKDKDILNQIKQNKSMVKSGNFRILPDHKKKDYLGFVRQITPFRYSQIKISK